MGWTVPVVRMKDMTDIYKILVEKPLGTRPLGYDVVD
jgi:hypothetical protein